MVHEHSFNQRSRKTVPYELRKDRRTVLGLSLIAALTGALSIPASLWEWDELLFARALHNFNVAAHSPHPPGFPVYMGVARLIRLFIHTDTLALGLASVLFTTLLGAGLFFSFRSIFRDRTVAAAASFLTLMSPVVLVFAGAPRSDVAGMAAGLAALALVLHSAKSERMLLASGVALGLASGVRVTVIPAVAPALLVVMIIHIHRGRWKPVVATALLSVLVALLCYAPVALDTGIPRYISSLKEHAQYTYTTDSIAADNVNRFLSYRLGRFFVDSWGGKDRARIVLALVLLGLALTGLMDRRGLVWLVVSFVPVMVFSVIYTTPLAGPLYSLPFLPLLTGLVAAFLIQGARTLARAVKRPRMSAVGSIAVIVFGILAAGWTWPIMVMRRTEASPPAQALRYLQEHVDREHAQIFYDNFFTPYVSYALQNWKTKLWNDDFMPFYDLLNPDFKRRPMYSLSTQPHIGKPGIHFAWSPGRIASRLRRLSLGRYSDAYLLDLTDHWNILWLDGWLGGQEFDGRMSLGSMGRRAHIALFTTASIMTLRFRSAVLRQAAGKRGSTVVLSLDGREIDRFINRGQDQERVLTLRTGLEDLWHILTIETNRSEVLPNVDFNEGARELGLQCFGIEWTPAEGAIFRAFEADQYLKEGWYLPEASWRWTMEQAALILPAMRWDGRLDLVLRVARDPSGKRGRITITVGGRTIDAFDPPPGVFTRTVKVPASLHGGRAADLVLSIDKTVLKPGGRRLGICVFYIGWIPDASSPSN